MIQRQHAILTPNRTGHLNLVANLLIKIPFEPCATKKADLQMSIRDTLKKVQLQLYHTYEHRTADFMWLKVLSAFLRLNLYSVKRSAIIYITSIDEQVFYSDHFTKELVVINRRITLDDLFGDSHDLHEYLAISLTPEHCNFYFGASESLSLTVSADINQVKNIESSRMPKIGAVSDIRKMIAYVDEVLGILLTSNKIPVFVVTDAETERSFSHYSSLATLVRKLITSPGKQNETEIINTLRPFLNHWISVRMSELMKEYRSAQNSGKLITGLASVKEAIKHAKCRTLIVANKNMSPLYLSDNNAMEIAHEINEHYTQASIKSVLTIIAAASRDKANIEVVNFESLDCFEGIAMIKH